MASETEKYKIAKGEYDGPFTGLHHDTIQFNGRTIYIFDSFPSVQEIAVLLNKVYELGRLKHGK